MIVDLGNGNKGKLHFDRRSPCKECPFRTDVALHEGVAAELPSILGSISAERFTHTCHETDPRSDYGPAKTYKGKLQHCAGALIMMEKSRCMSGPMADAVGSGALKLHRLNMRAPVYKLREFIRAYLDWLEAKFPGARAGG